MHQNWQKFLHHQPTTEQAGDATDNTIFNLQAEALIHIHGPDAEDFLQSQFSNDIRTMTRNQGQSSCYCNPKGRIIALLRCGPACDQNASGNQPTGYFLTLPKSLEETVLQRLNLYRMRAKVEINTSSGFVHFGARGTAVSHWLREQSLLPDANPYRCKTTGTCQVIRLDANRYLLIAPPAQAIEFWEKLRSFCQMADIEHWRLADILAGTPVVIKDTSELFTPQMLNLDLLGAISFSKGCYPGQEIIARMHYLGRNRQRMIRCVGTTDTSIRAGMPIYGSAANLKIGTVVNAVSKPDGSCHLLASVKLDFVNQALYANSAQGLALQPQPLPYPIPELPAQESFTSNR